MEKGWDRPGRRHKTLPTKTKTENTQKNPARQETLSGWFFCPLAGCGVRQLGDTYVSRMRYRPLAGSGLHLLGQAHCLLTANVIVPLRGVDCIGKPDGNHPQNAAPFLQNTRFFAVMQGGRGNFKRKKPQNPFFFSANPLFGKENTAFFPAVRTIAKKRTFPWNIRFSSLFTHPAG